MWTFVTIRREFGSKHMISQHTDEQYIIKATGTWIPTVDLEWLESIRLYCPACGQFPVRAFHKANPSAKQVAAMPKRNPRESKSGLEKRRPRRRPRKKKGS